MIIPPNYAELVARCNGSYVPKCLDDFIGRTKSKKGVGARVAAEDLQRSVMLARAIGKTPLKYLYNGEPGLGKSMLAHWLQKLLGCDQFSTDKLNGTQVNMEKLNELDGTFGSSCLFNDYRLLWVDETDKIPHAAQVRFLTFLDNLPNGRAVICTSNCALTEFEPRFQSRFQAVEILPPEPCDIELLLRRFVAPQVAQQIATFACGNVRAALLDAKLEMDSVLAEAA